MLSFCPISSPSFFGGFEGCMSTFEGEFMKERGDSQMVCLPVFFSKRKRRGVHNQSILFSMFWLFTAQKKKSGGCDDAFYEMKKRGERFLWMWRRRTALFFFFLEVVSFLFGGRGRGAENEENTLATERGERSKYTKGLKLTRRCPRRPWGQGSSAGSQETQS